MRPLVLILLLIVPGVVAGSLPDPLAMPPPPEGRNGTTLPDAPAEAPVQESSAPAAPQGEQGIALSAPAVSVALAVAVAGLVLLGVADRRAARRQRDRRG